MEIEAPRPWLAVGSNDPDQYCWGSESKDEIYSASSDVHVIVLRSFRSSGPLEARDSFRVLDHSPAPPHGPQSPIKVCVAGDAEQRVQSETEHA